LYYTPQIFRQPGLSGNTMSLLAAGVVEIVMFIAIIPAVLWIDRVGRKPLTWGAICMGTCYIIIAIPLARNIDRFPETLAVAWAAVSMVWLFVIHFGYSWGLCGWIIIAEIWPLSPRPYGVALQATPKLLESINYGTYILYGILMYLCAAFIWFVVPETKRLTLEEKKTNVEPESAAQADIECIEEINHGIGLAAVLSRRGEGRQEDERRGKEFVEMA
ncbi:hypothetical protein K505DRAFT_244391, partial [Melanomma pulvis-pyrius CBS 109.77]